MQIEYFNTLGNGHQLLMYCNVRGLKLVGAKARNERNKLRHSPYNDEVLLIVGILYGRTFLYFWKIFEKLARGHSVAATALGSCYEQR